MADDKPKDAAAAASASEEAPPPPPQAGGDDAPPPLEGETADAGKEGDAQPKEGEAGGASKAQEIAARLSSKAAAAAAAAADDDDAEAAQSSTLGKRPRDDEGGSDDYAKRKKITVPVKDHPDVNFVELLFGESNRTLHRLEDESGARIHIRGRGSKDGEVEEDLHVVIEAPNDEVLAKATSLVEDLLHNANKAAAAGGKPADAGGDKALALTDSLYDQSAVGETAARFFGNSAPGGGTDTLREMKVPNDSAGQIIGRRGETIRTLEAQTGARIQVARDGDEEGKRTVTLSGSEESVKQAEAAIATLLSSRAAAGGPGASNVHAPPGVDIVTEVIKASHDRAGSVIGRGGETVRALQDRTGCSIQVQRDSERDPETGERNVTLSGTAEAVAAARAEIENILSGGSFVPPPSAGPAGYAAPPPGADMVLYVPNQSAGGIIGRGGETIKMLQQRTGARIQVAKSQPGGGRDADRMVTIFGDPRQAEYAHAEIARIVYDSCGQYPTVVSGGGAAAGGGYGQQGGAGGYGQQAGGYGGAAGAAGGYGQQGAAAGQQGQGAYDYAAYYQQYYAYYGQAPPPQHQQAYGGQQQGQAPPQQAPQGQYGAYQQQYGGQQQQYGAPGQQGQHYGASPSSSYGQHQRR